ncbi:MAG TPA: YdcF family protein [Anaerolineales bacterium]|nr:YdcF family protein [Anaerolineales bacterium]
MARNLLIAGVVLLAMAVLAYALRAPILTGIADGLVVSDTPRAADIIFLLNGDYNTRPQRAAELYRQGLAPLIVIARSENTPAVDLGLVPNDTDISVEVMQKLGVPPDKILVLAFPGGVTSTFDEASALHRYIQSHPVHTVLLVTSAFHTRRARWIFKRELAGTPIELKMVAVPYQGFDQTNWWKNETGLITLNNEYIKLIYYFVKYR